MRVLRTKSQARLQKSQPLPLLVRSRPVLRFRRRVAISRRNGRRRRRRDHGARSKLRKRDHGARKLVLRGTNKVALHGTNQLVDHGTNNPGVSPSFPEYAQQQERRILQLHRPSSQRGRRRRSGRCHPLWWQEGLVHHHRSARDLSSSKRQCKRS